MKKFYLCGAWLKDRSQDEVRTKTGIHGQVGLMTEAIPRLRAAGIEVMPNWWGAIEKDPSIADDLWGMFVERHGLTITRFAKALPTFSFPERWCIVRFHAAHQATDIEFDEFFPYVDVALGTHELVCEDLRKIGYPRVDLCQWGTPTYWEYPPSQPDPYDHSVRNIIWAGRLDAREAGRLRVMEEIYRRDPTVKIHIITQSIKKGILCAEQLPPNCIIHGVMTSGTFNHFVYYADLAIDMGIPRMRWLNCKNYDYLGMGCPVVANRVPGAEPIEETGHGIVLDTFDESAYVDAVFRGLNTDWGSRDKVIKYMQENNGWDKPAAVLEKYIRLGQELGYDTSS